MSIPKYTAEDLKTLPLRAIVALAARCARRVENLALFPDADPRAAGCRTAVSDALQMAEGFASGLPCGTSESVVHELETCREAAQGNAVQQDAIAAVIQAALTASTALNVLDIRSEPAERHPLGPAPEPGPLSHLPEVTAELAALSAFTAAVDAAGAAGYSESFIEGASNDYRTILGLRLGTYPEAGQPIDPSAGGPLGPILPE